MLQACGGGGEIQSSPIVLNNNIDVYILGSSTLENMIPALESTAKTYNYNIHNYAKGGEQLYTMCLRIGAFPGTVKFSNNNLSSSTKNYFIADWPLDYSLKTFDAEVNNIKGQVGADKNGYYFQFNTPSSILVDTNINYPVHSSIPTTSNNAIFIVNLGKNNFYQSNPEINTSEYIISESKKCINWISENLTNKILVVGFFSTTQANDSLINKVNTVNSSLSDTYKNAFYDIEKYIESDQVWSDTKIKPTNNDLSNQKNHILPSSLAKDALHVNETINIALSKKLLDSLAQFK
ncbi:hypothetical protein CAP51_07210 [Acinetobacter populi]|uniref:SGNH hydrolase-type esterase domain-containing protein n=2 Tax=Acinetobacter populi TaxID=1582270 RepID=A0A1Z9YZ93_9GAMM|nr:hypothetical protein CAP51_07210 [Acinetobacter populi]